MKKDNFLAGVAGGGENRYNISTLRGLQEAHLAWVRHNFPAQLGSVTAGDVRRVVGDEKSGPKNFFALIAEALNAGDPRLVKRKHHGVLGALEELGELAHAFLKMEQGIRGGLAKDKWEAEAQDAVVDCIFFLISFCNTHGWQLDDMVLKTALEVFRRDWVKYPEKGVPPAMTAEPNEVCRQPHPGHIPERECYEPVCHESCGIQEKVPLPPAEEELQKLRAFKKYVHDRLDKIGVPVDPNPGLTRETGCRIGQRLNWIRDRLSPPDQAGPSPAQNDDKCRGIERGVYWVSEFPQGQSSFQPVLATWVGDHWRTVATNGRYGDDRIPAGRVKWWLGPLVPECS